MMELINEISKLDTEQLDQYQILKESVNALMIMLSPIAPHICHHLWHKAGNIETILDTSWPQVDPDALIQQEQTIIVQVNGKLRAKLNLAVGLDEDHIKQTASTDERVIKFTEGKQIVKVIYVPNKLVNIVVK